MQHGPLSAVVGAVILLAGCAVSAPVGRPSIDVAAAQARAAEIDSRSMTRDGVHALLGQPWLSSEAFDIEIYRLQGKQHNLLVIFAPYPVPLPDFSDKLETYTLVVYGEDGQVSERNFGFASSSTGSPPTLILRAGEFEFVHGFGDTISVTLDRYLQVRAARAAGPTCTVLLGCDEARLAAAGDRGFCACSTNLRVDDGERQSLSLMAPAVIPYERAMPATECAATGGRFQPLGETGVGSCIYTPRALYPLTLTAGRHLLRFSMKRSEQAAPVEVACESEGVSRVTLGGKFMLCTRFENERMQVDRPKESSIALTQLTLPAQPDMRVLVYDHGAWLYPTP
jgi:hypothetical protein